MSAQDVTALIGWGIEALIGATAMMVVVLLVRGAVRRAFGAQVAYALWALPLLRLVLPPMPVGWRVAVATPVAAIGEQVTVLIVPDAGAAAVAAAALPAVATAAGPSLALVLVALWAAGAVALLARHVVGYARFRARVLRQATWIDTIDGIAVIASPGAPGPLAFGVRRRFVAFPADFASRYEPAERDLALAHEIGHHARGDLIANWIALAALAVQWVSPIAWIAFRAFRSDQEMANDARVLATRRDTDAHAYACAIVKAAHGGAVAAVCHLHTVHDLKGRLRMLGKARATRTRTMAGTAGVAMLALAGLGATASGTRAAASVRAGVRDSVERVTGVDVAALLPVATPTSAPAAPVPPARKSSRVVVVKDGKATTYEGAQAQAYLAANPVDLPMPPVPPTPPVPAAPPVPSTPALPALPALPPMPPIPPTSVIPSVATSGTQVTRVIVRRDGRTTSDRTVFVDIPRTVTRDCDAAEQQPAIVTSSGASGGKRTIVICRNRLPMLARFTDTQRAGQVERDALRRALAGLRNARAGIAANASIPAEGRAQALAAIDTSIAEVEGGMARAR